MKIIARVLRRISSAEGFPNCLLHPLHTAFPRMPNWAADRCPIAVVPLEEEHGGRAAYGKGILATVSQELAGMKLTPSERLTRLNEIIPTQVDETEAAMTISLFGRTPAGRACSGVRYRSRPFGTSGLTPAARRIPCAKSPDAVASRLT